MNQNEITIKINCSLDELHEILISKGFSISRTFNMKDTYFIPNSLKIEDLSSREILKHAVIVRTLKYPNKDWIFLTHKHKEFDEFGNITFQKSTNCEVINVQDAENFLTCLNYNTLLKMEENTNVYKRDNLELAVKNITNGDNLIEIETTEDDDMNTIEKLICSLKSLDIPIDTSNYFVKKAELALENILNKKD